MVEVESMADLERNVYAVSHITRLFKILDKDNDGHISNEDLHQLLTQLGFDLTFEQVRLAQRTETNLETVTANQVERIFFLLKSVENMNSRENLPKEKQRPKLKRNRSSPAMPKFNHNNHKKINKYKKKPPTSPPKPPQPPSSYHRRQNSKSSMPKPNKNNIQSSPSWKPPIPNGPRPQKSQISYEPLKLENDNEDFVFGEIEQIEGYVHPPEKYQVSIGVEVLGDVEVNQMAQQQQKKQQSFVAPIPPPAPRPERRILNAGQNKKLLQKRKSAPSFSHKHIQHILPLDLENQNVIPVVAVAAKKKPSQPEPRPRSRSEEERLLKIALHESMQHEKKRPQKQVDREQLELELALVQSLSEGQPQHQQKTEKQIQQEQLLNQIFNESMECDRYRKIQNQEKKRVASERLMWFINAEDGEEEEENLIKASVKEKKSEKPKFMKQKLKFQKRPMEPEENLDKEFLLEEELYAPRKETVKEKKRQQQRVFSSYCGKINPNPPSLSPPPPAPLPPQQKQHNNDIQLQEEMKNLIAMFSPQLQDKESKSRPSQLNKRRPPVSSPKPEQPTIVPIIHVQGKNEKIVMPQQLNAVRKELKREPYSPLLQQKNKFSKHLNHNNNNIQKKYSSDLNLNYDVIELFDAKDELVDAKDEFELRHFPSIPSLSPVQELELETQSLRFENKKLKSKLESFNIISSLLKEAKYNYSPELWHLITEICESQEQR